MGILDFPHFWGKSGEPRIPWIFGARGQKISPIPGHFPTFVIRMRKLIEMVYFFKKSGPQSCQKRPPSDVPGYPPLKVLFALFIKSYIFGFGIMSAFVPEMLGSQENQ